jgi:dGTP triphosphohydrolase
LTAERCRSMAMVEELFQYFAADAGRMPEPYRSRAASQPLYRVVCDYLAGMTDAFLRRTHEQMLG